MNRVLTSIIQEEWIPSRRGILIIKAEGTKNLKDEVEERSRSQDVRYTQRRLHVRDV